MADRAFNQLQIGFDGTSSDLTDLIIDTDAIDILISPERQIDIIGRNNFV